MLYAISTIDTIACNLEVWDKYISTIGCLSQLAHTCDVFAKGFPDSKVHGANMGPIWDRQDPGGSHVGPMNFAIWEL